jgi:hypothetical protein
MAKSVAAPKNTSAYLHQGTDNGVKFAVIKIGYNVIFEPEDYALFEV